MAWFYLKHFYLNYQLNNWNNFTSNILQIIWYITFSNVWLDKNIKLTSFSFDVIRIFRFMGIVSGKMRNGAKFRSFSYLGLQGTPFQPVIIIIDTPPPPPPIWPTPFFIYSEPSVFVKTFPTKHILKLQNKNIWEEKHQHWNFVI